MSTTDDTTADGSRAAGPVEGFRADAFVAVVLLTIAVAAGFVGEGGSYRLLELLLLATGVVASYLVRWRWAWAVAAVTAIAYIGIEAHAGRVDRHHYWEQVLYVTGILGACLAAGYLRLGVDSRRGGVSRALARSDADRAGENLADRLSGGRRLSALEVEIERSRRHNHRVSLLVIRPDEFDDIAVHRGDTAAGEVLQTIADAIGDNLRATDSAVQQGPFDFWVVLPETPADGARTVAERIRLAVGAQRLDFGPGEMLDLSVSIGVATFPDDAASNDDLAAAAQRALARAVERGGNRSIVCSAGGGSPSGWGLAVTPGAPGSAGTG